MAIPERASNAGYIHRYRTNVDRIDALNTAILAAWALALFITADLRGEPPSQYVTMDRLAGVTVWLVIMLAVIFIRVTGVIHNNFDLRMLGQVAIITIWTTIAVSLWAFTPFSPGCFVYSVLVLSCLYRLVELARQ